MTIIPTQQDIIGYKRFNLMGRYFFFLIFWLSDKYYFYYLVDTENKYFCNDTKEDIYPILYNNFVCSFCIYYFDIYFVVEKSVLPI